MELFFRLKGDLPSLGSHKDIVLRQYLERELLKESLFNKLSLLASIGVNKDNSKSFFKDYKSYINLHFLLDDLVENEEDKLRDDYEKIKNTRPKIFLENGVLKVKDLITD